MDLSLSKEQLSVRDSVRSFAQRESMRAELQTLRRSGQLWKPEWYRQFARAGWTALVIPEEQGGAQLDPTSVVVFMAEMGRHAIPSPLFVSSILSTSILLGAEQTDVRDAILGGIAAGEAIVVPAVRRPKTSWKGLLGSPATLTGAAGSRVLDAMMVYVPWAADATHFLVSVDAADGATFALVPADSEGISVRHLGGFLHAHYEVVFSDVAVPEDNLIRTATGTELDDAMSIARVALAAYQFGGCEEMLDMSIQHSNTRQQFGQPIGRFQRVQDHIVRLINALDAARWTTYEAAWALENDRNGAGRSYLAASTASESCLEAANAAHEVHAGLGSDPDYGLTVYTQASRTLYALLGDPKWQRSRMAPTLGWVA
ncbi:acyl-CoA dehydrogenase family protein [Streptomyces sp. NPDC050625]|uniref:acyl-CoA dehydrogenase family protein n=1 Tax=Streptomyces sp. NPDC050625 TaxID=3154629 RepID=UPI00344956AD